MKLLFWSGRDRRIYLPVDSGHRRYEFPRGSSVALRLLVDFYDGLQLRKKIMLTGFSASVVAVDGNPTSILLWREERGTRDAMLLLDLFRGWSVGGS
jgi:hypothetical protein